MVQARAFRSAEKPFAARAPCATSPVDDMRAGRDLRRVQFNVPAEIDYYTGAVALWPCACARACVCGFQDDVLFL